MKKKVVPFLLFSMIFFSLFQIEAYGEIQKEWQNESIYYLVIDRFNNGDSQNDFHIDVHDPHKFHGGDFQGIVGQLDYIKGMGFTTICLTPIFDNGEDGYHGYWTKDFYATEENFGTIDDFKKLVKEAHNREMKVIVEFQANSVGKQHPWLNDPEKQDWFENENLEARDDTETAWLDGLAQLAIENPEVQAYLIDVAEWWLEETNIDGYKFVLAENVSFRFFEYLSANLKKNDPNILLLADLPTGDPISFQNAGIDSFLDYQGNSSIRTAFSKPNQSIHNHFSIIENDQERNQHSNLLVNFLDNQHQQRFTRDVIEKNLHPGSRWKLALTYLYTIPGIPMVYYGSEIALDGGLGDDNRRQMDFMTDKELIDYMTKIGDLRRNLPSLSSGTFTPLYEKEGMLVYKRETDSEVTVVAINNTTKTQAVTLDESELQSDKELRGLLNDDLVKSENNQYKIIIDRDEAEIYLLSEKSGLNIPYILLLSAVYIAFIGFVFLLIKRGRRKSAN